MEEALHSATRQSSPQKKNRNGQQGNMSLLKISSVRARASVTSFEDLASTGPCGVITIEITIRACPDKGQVRDSQNGSAQASTGRRHRVYEDSTSTAKGHELCGGLRNGLCPLR